jgi:hypothetical protein
VFLKPNVFSFSLESMEELAQLAEEVSRLFVCVWLKSG